MKYTDMTLEDKKRYIREYSGLMKNCDGIKCSECPISKYETGAGYCYDFIKTIKRDVEEAEKNSEVEENSMEMKIKIDKNYVFTPENTTLEYMLENDILEAVADYLDQNNGSICGNHSCSNCPIHQRNFSEEWGDVGRGCADVRIEIKGAAKLIPRIKPYFEGNTTNKKASGECKSCKYRKQHGEYVYCDAWKNFTTDTMTCGYYLTKAE